VVAYGPLAPHPVDPKCTTPKEASVESSRIEDRLQCQPLLDDGVCCSEQRDTAKAWATPARQLSDEDSSAAVDCGYMQEGIQVADGSSPEEKLGYEWRQHEEHNDWSIENFRKFMTTNLQLFRFTAIAFYSYCIFRLAALVTALVIASAKVGTS
jgi:hypothetical protein